MSEKSKPQSSELPIGKIVGRRRLSPTTTLEDADRLLRTAWALRGTERLVPRGLYRFETFEEAEQWMIQMMARTHARRRSEPRQCSEAGGTPALPAKQLCNRLSLDRRHGISTD
jgi:hypothetical protein